MRFNPRIRAMPAAFCLAVAVLTFAGSASAQEITGHPLTDIAFDMNIAVRRLAKNMTDETTQQVQTDVVGRLDALIKLLEEQQQQFGRGRSGARPRDPARASMVMQGPGGSGPLRQARKDGKHWAELPPHERDKIMQSMTEGFPAHYQNILESYFKRLAEEKPAEAEPPADAKKVPSAPATTSNAKEPAAATTKESATPKEK
jgi:hypothetical protein